MTLSRGLTNSINAGRLQRAQGQGRITTSVRDGKTCLATFYQDGCAKIRLPHTHDDTMQAVIINTAGGLTGGDEICWQAEAAPGANLVLTTQACERVYRSTGLDAQVRTQLRVGAGAHVDWLPQETILFQKGRLNRSLDVDLAEDATLCAVEAVLLGREAMGEEARGAYLKDNWRIRRSGRLIHAEATLLTGSGDRERDGLALLDGANAFATVLFVGPNPERKLDAVRAVLPEGGRAAASAVGDRLIVRTIAQSGLALRRVIVPVIAMLSGAGALPRLWSL
jgi:urease accessory protein